MGCIKLILVLLRQLTIECSTQNEWEGQSTFGILDTSPRGSPPTAAQVPLVWYLESRGLMNFCLTVIITYEPKILSWLKGKPRVCPFKTLSYKEANLESWTTCYQKWYKE